MHLKQRRVCRQTFFLFSRSAMLFSRDFSCALRFFNRVSGTRIWSLVATVLQIQGKAHVSTIGTFGAKLAESDMREGGHSRMIVAELDEMNLISEQGQSKRELTIAHIPEAHLTRPCKSARKDRHLKILASTTCIRQCWDDATVLYFKTEKVTSTLNVPRPCIHSICGRGCCAFK